MRRSVGLLAAVVVTTLTGSAYAGGNQYQQQQAQQRQQQQAQRSKQQMAQQRKRTDDQQRTKQQQKQQQQKQAAQNLRSKPSTPFRGSRANSSWGGSNVHMMSASSVRVGESIYQRVGAMKTPIVQQIHSQRSSSGRFYMTWHGIGLKNRGDSVRFHPFAAMLGRESIERMGGDDPTGALYGAGPHKEQAEAEQRLADAKLATELHQRQMQEANESSKTSVRRAVDQAIRNEARANQSGTASAPAAKPPAPTSPAPTASAAPAAPPTASAN